MKETQLIGPLTDQVDELQFILNHELEKMMQSIKQDVWSDEKEGISKNSPEGSTIQVLRSIHDNRQRAISEAQKDADHSLPLMIEELHALHRETVGLRSLVQQLQIEHDNDTIGSV
jgi:hypothetical protein